MRNDHKKKTFYFIIGICIIFTTLLILGRNEGNVELFDHNEAKSKLHKQRSLLDQQINDSGQALEESDIDVNYLQEDPNLKYLQPNLIPAIVHFVWCGYFWFEFRHYLSVKSAIQVYRPDKIIFHYEKLPVDDRRYYNQWFQWLLHDFEFLHVEELPTEWVQLCHVDLNSYNRLLLFLLNQEGGMYLGIETILTELSVEHRKKDFVFGMEPEGTEGLILLRKEVLNNVAKKVNGTFSLNDIFYDENVQSEGITCCTSKQYLRAASKCVNCVLAKGTTYQNFKPRDIWETQDSIGRLARRIFYNTEKILTPQPSYDTLVPNIGHMIWIGGGEINFVFYLSALSMLHVMEVEHLYIHGDKHLTGPYWNKLENNDAITFVTVPRPYVIYGGGIHRQFRALMSDLLRVEIMIKYGGIYSDTDAIWVKKLSNEERGYDAVASYDWVDWSYPFPDTVNFGVSYGKRNAPFWRIFRDSMRHLHNDVHGFTGVMMPYKLLERYPHLLKIDRHLSVICYKFRCHPTWVKDYHNQTNDHVVSNTIPEWKTDVHAFHWTYPNPREYADYDTLVKSTGFFAEIGQNVLKKAGLL